MLLWTSLVWRPFYNIAKLAGETSGDEKQLARAKRIHEEFVDQCKLGVKSGEQTYS